MNKRHQYIQTINIASIAILFGIDSDAEMLSVTLFKLLWYNLDKRNVSIYPDHRDTQYWLFNVLNCILFIHNMVAQKYSDDSKGFHGFV